MKNDNLISRAALGIGKCDPNVFIDKAYGDGWNACINIIEAAPSVDAVPVVHAHWVYKERHRKSYRTYTGFDAAGEEHTVTVCQESTGKEPYCSNCGAQAAESFMDYCPKCGAKMTGD